MGVAVNSNGIEMTLCILKPRRLNTRVVQGPPDPNGRPIWYPQSTPDPPLGYFGGCLTQLGTGAEAKFRPPKQFGLFSAGCTAGTQKTSPHPLSYSPAASAVHRGHWQRQVSPPPPLTCLRHLVTWPLPLHPVAFTATDTLA